MDSMFLHLGALAFLAGFFVKDMVMSRGLFALGAAAGIAHAAGASANIGLIGWLLLFVMANFFVIWRALKARLETPLTEVETALHTRLAQFALPDFKRLMRIAEWQTLIDAKQITHQGAPTDHLYYIVSGSAQVDKSGTLIDVTQGTLIGEISFTQSVPATATVTAAPGTTLVAFPRKKLNRLLRRPRLKAAFDDLLSHDLAEKLAADTQRANSSS